MTYAEANDARHFVAAIPPHIFAKKYTPVITSEQFSTVISQQADPTDIFAVANALHDAGTPGRLLNEDAKIIDIAGHFLQMYLYYSNRRC